MNAIAENIQSIELIFIIRLSYITKIVVIRESKKMKHLVLLYCFLLAARVLAQAQAPCAPPDGFKDAPHPSIAPAEQLVSHTEQVVIAQSKSVISAVMNKPLEKTIAKSNSLPGVSGDYMLTKGSYGEIGSRRIVCLTDGTTTEEEALAREDSSTAGHFRYIVWNYTTPKARPVSYGVGDFKTVQQDPGHTLVTWTYSFKLKDDTFPGEFGSLGRWLFRVDFLDRDYAAMMRGVLQSYKEAAEQIPATSPQAQQ